jgi:hypothetical protein
LTNHLISFALSFIYGSTDPVRLRLEAESAKWFCWLLISGAVVALGCILEVWETYVSLVGWWQRKKGQPHEENETSWRIPMAALGLLLVIGGVIGETVFEGLVSNADAAIRTHESEVLSAAEAKASIADKNAADAELKASGLQKDTQALKTDAEQAHRDAEIERRKRVEIEQRLAWRRVSPSQYASLSKALLPFANTKVIVFVFHNEDIEAKTFAGDLVHLLHDGAHWNPWLNDTNETSDVPTGLLCQLDLSSAAGRALAKVCNAYPNATVTPGETPGWIGVIRVGLKPPP